MDSFPFEIIRSNDDAKKPTVIFIAGFPDNQLSALHPSIPEAIAKEYNMVCLCLPGYEKGCKTIRPWGYDMDELISMLHRSITVHGKAGQPVYLMAHDWGAYLALIHLRKYPDQVSKLFLLDIGEADIFTIRIKDILFMAPYQMWFAMSYFISQVFGHFIGTIVVWTFYLSIFRPIWPTTTKNESPAFPVEELFVEKCYPYYYFWKNLITNRDDMKLKFPPCPTLFLYGTEKRCFFHSSNFLRKLDETDGCKYMAIQGGHWFANTHPGVVIEEGLKFFAT